MSFDLMLRDTDGNLFALDEPETWCGTQPVGGYTESELNITYNYSWYYRRFLDEELGIRWLYGRTAKDCVARLEKAIEPFKDMRRYEKDYWADTPGNCVAPLIVLLGWCRKFPDGVFSGD